MQGFDMGKAIALSDNKGDRFTKQTKTQTISTS